MIGLFADHYYISFLTLYVFGQENVIFISEKPRNFEKLVPPVAAMGCYYKKTRLSENLSI